MDSKHLEKLVEVDQKTKANSKRLDLISKKIDDIHDLTISVKELAMETKAMREDLNKMDQRIRIIEEKPSKRYDLIWGYIISTIIGGIVSYCLIRLGLK